MAVKSKAPAAHCGHEARGHHAPARIARRKFIGFGISSSSRRCRGSCADIIAQFVPAEIYFRNHRTMKEGPDISVVAALIGDPARAHMLMALLAGPALTATELAQEAGLGSVDRQRTSGHARGCRLWSRSRPGPAPLFPPRRSRHGAGARGVDTARCAHRRTCACAPAHATRSCAARASCYDHLAGDLAVAMLDRFVERRLLAPPRRGRSRMTQRRPPASLSGAASTAETSSAGGRRGCAAACLDWSERRQPPGRRAGRRGLGRISLRRRAGRVRRGEKKERGSYSFPRPAGSEMRASFFSVVSVPRAVCPCSQRRPAAQCFLSGST